MFFCCVFIWILSCSMFSAFACAKNQTGNQPTSNAQTPTTSQMFTRASTSVWYLCVGVGVGVGVHAHIGCAIWTSVGVGLFVVDTIWSTFSRSLALMHTTYSRVATRASLQVIHHSTHITHNTHHTQHTNILTISITTPFIIDRVNRIESFHNHQALIHLIYVMECHYM